MKIFTLSMIITSSLVLIGCGSSSSGDNTPKINEVTSVKEAEKNLNAMTAFQSINLSVLDSSNTNKVLNVNKFSSAKLSKLQKTETVACRDSGTITLDLSEDEKTLIYTIDKCQSGSTYMDGKIKFIEEDDNSIEIDYEKLTFKDVGGTQYMDFNMKLSIEASIVTLVMNGVINQTSTAGEVNNMKVTSFIIKDKDTSSESWSTIDGTMEFESKCVTGAYTFETVDKLVDARDGSDNIESGILKLNGATYTFDNPHVTIDAGSESETMLQSELDKRMNESSSCTI